MKYGIYKGEFVEVIDSSELIVYISAEGTITGVSREEVLEIAEEKFLAVKTELAKVREEIFNIRERIGNLDKAYHDKKNTLYQMFMDVRQKEVSIINQLINTQ